MSLRFYRRGLGLKTEGIFGQEFEHGAVVFIDLQSGVRLAHKYSSLPTRHSGVAMPAIFRISTAMYGRWSITLPGMAPSARLESQHQPLLPGNAPARAARYRLRLA